MNTYDEIDAVESRIKEAINEMRSSLKDKDRAKESSLRVLEEASNDKDKEIHSLRAEMDRNRHQLSTAKDEINRLEKSRIDNQLEKDQLESELRKLSRGKYELEALKSQFEQSKSEYDSRGKYDLEALKRQFEQSKSEYEIKNLREKESFDALIEVQKKEFDTTLRSYESRIEELVRENEMLRQNTHELERKVSDSRKLAATNEAQARALATDKAAVVLEWEKERKRLQSHHDDQMKSHHEDTEAKLQLQNSKMAQFELKYRGKVADYETEVTKLRDSMLQAENSYSSKVSDIEQKLTVATRLKNELTHKLDMVSNSNAELNVKLEQISKARDAMQEEFNRREQVLHETYDRNIKHLREQYRSVISLRTSNWRFNDSRFSALLDGLLNELDEMPIGVFPHRLSYEEMPEQPTGRLDNFSYFANSAPVPQRITVAYDATDIIHQQTGYSVSPTPSRRPIYQHSQHRVAPMTTPSYYATSPTAAIYNTAARLFP